MAQHSGCFTVEDKWRSIVAASLWNINGVAQWLLHCGRQAAQQSACVTVGRKWCTLTDDSCGRNVAQHSGCNNVEVKWRNVVAASLWRRSSAE